jgi:hypothetical protein
MSKLLDLYIRRNGVELMDTNFQFGQDSEEKSFYSVNRGDFDFTERAASSSEILFKAIIRLDPVIDNYDRTVLSVIDITGNVGGVLEIAIILGGYVVGLFSNRLFFSSILPWLYQYDGYRKKFGSFYH